MKQSLFNIDIDITDKNEVIETCKSFFNSKEVHSIFFLNAHCYNVAIENKDYEEALKNSDLVLNDGIGIKLASKLAGIKLKENLNGTDLIPELLKLCAENGKSVYLLGGKEGVAERAAESLSGSFPGIKIAGTNSGYFAESDEPDLIRKIDDSEASILVIGMGVPRQELFATRNKEKFKHIKVLIAGGAIIDFLSGNIKRAPMWMRKNGVEWVYRLYQEPIRLWRRYLFGNVLFFYNLFQSRRQTK
jgi:N-acetylglucosaminyldiphosphoundecaprenol N-acetyl-beta-D-mannosaminyltransferase